ncbi:MAG: TetR/AcrR family transcriptional regulator [Anaeromyxobacter sp.]
MPAKRTRPPRSTRDRLLEAAEPEFAAHGLEGASLNRILAAAGVPKGAAYHHFEDKAALFAAAAVRAIEALEGDLGRWLESVTADGYWEGLAGLLAGPWEPDDRGAALLRAMRAVRAGDARRESPALEAAVERLQGLALAVVRRGRALGLVRDDLPEDLLAALLVGLDDAFDGWLLPREAALAPREREAVVRAAGDAVRRVLEQGRRP